MASSIFCSICFRCSWTSHSAASHVVIAAVFIKTPCEECSISRLDFPDCGKKGSFGLWVVIHGRISAQFDEVSFSMESFVEFVELFLHVLSLLIGELSFFQVQCLVFGSVVVQV